MFEVVLAVSAVALAAWGFLEPKYTEKVRAKIRLRPRRLLLLGGIILTLIAVHPILHASIAPERQSTRDWVLAGGHSLILACFSAGALTLWPFGRWTIAELKLFHRRIEQLILTRRSHVVVDVLDQALPSLPHRMADHIVDQTAGNYIDCYDRAIEDALMYNDFIRSAARHNRVFLSQIFTLQSRSGLYASGRVLHDLMFGPGKLLALELKAADNFAPPTETQHAYWIPERCIILHALFDDIGVAEKLGAWKPVGEGVVAHIRSMVNKKDQDQDQQSGDDYREEDRWESPVGAGLWYFRIMLTSAAIQGQRYHMWFPYLRHFVREMVAVIHVDAATAGDEFPNRYCRWIRDCVDCCCKVIEISKDLPPENRNSSRAVTDLDNLDGVLKAAYRIYAECVATILNSDRLPDRFKADQIESLLSDFKTWEQQPYADGIAAKVVSAVASETPAESRAMLIRNIEEIAKTESTPEVRVRFTAAWTEARRPR